MVVNWSTCLPSTLTIRVRVPPKSTFLFCKLCENQQKEAGDGPLTNNSVVTFQWLTCLPYNLDIQGSNPVVEESMERMMTPNVKASM